MTRKSLDIESAIEALELAYNGLESFDNVSKMLSSKESEGSEVPPMFWKS